MFDDLLALLGSARFWLDAAILTAIVRFVWTAVQKIFESLLFVFSLRTRVLEVHFGAHPDAPREIEALHYLLFRYGNDTYLKELASDQERHHGRLRNIVRKVEVSDLPDGGKGIKFRLKVHKRLGTQFKLFIDVAGDPAAVVRYLDSHANVYDVEPSPRPGNRSRVFFLVREFPTITTVDGFENNMIWPV